MHASHHGGVDDYRDFDRLSSAVYIAARSGAVDCMAAFDPAASWLEERPHDPDATELATLSLECTQASQSRMAEVALRLLATANFRPGFKEEPGWLACLEDAMRLVNRDVAATGIRRPCKLRVHDDDGLNWSVNAYVETWDGYTGTRLEGIYPASGADPVSALVDVADDAQDALMHARCRRLSVTWGARLIDPIRGLHIPAPLRTADQCPARLDKVTRSTAGCRSHRGPRKGREPGGIAASGPHRPQSQREISPSIEVKGAMRLRRPGTSRRPRPGPGRGP